jgi:phenylacetate-CoA ligase
MPPATIQAEQLARLRALLAAILPANPFYRDKLEACGLGPGVGSLEEFCERAPFTTKQELVEDQLRNPPYGTNLTYALERYTRFCQTSGTTGAPLRWLDTPESWDWMVENWARVFQAAGVGPGDRVFFAFSFGPFLGFWLAFESAARLGCLCIPGGGMGSASRLQAILDNQVTVLCCTPTYALRLAEVSGEEKIDLRAGRVRRIILGGEPGGSIPATRARMETLWPGARAVDHHGMTEIGPVTYGCPQRPDILHVIESAFVAEVIDPQSGQAREQGELVLTNLGRVGSPLLRYRTGDLVRRGDRSRCACGSFELALEGGILGRVDDMLVVRGVNVYPSAIEAVLRAVEGVAEYRVQVRSERALRELELEIEPTLGHEDGTGLGRRVQAALDKALGLRVEVAVVSCGSLPRFEVKARRWIKSSTA